MSTPLLTLPYLLDPPDGSTGSPPMAARSTTCHRKDRSTFPAEISVGRAHDTKEPLFVCVVHDVSERRDLEAAVLDAVSQEQRRFATDLHDGLGQELTGLALLLSALASEARAQGDAEHRAADLDRACEVAKHAMHSSQSIARGLFPMGPSDGGLIRALRDLVSRMQDTVGTAVAISVSEVWRLGLSPTVSDHLYRIAQEALTNALKHADATTIKLTLNVERENVRLEICDDGKGVRAPVSKPVGLGLRTMQYRAAMIGARFEIAALKPMGTRVICDCPQTA
jgi:two-component system, LuxR family, sensor kinase FixL